MSDVTPRGVIGQHCLLDGLDGIIDATDAPLRTLFNPVYVKYMGIVEPEDFNMMREQITEYVTAEAIRIAQALNVVGKWEIKFLRTPIANEFYFFIFVDGLMC